MFESENFKQIKLIACIKTSNFRSRSIIRQYLGPVSGPRDNSPPRDNFMERLYGVVVLSDTFQFFFRDSLNFIIPLYLLRMFF